VEHIVTPGTKKWILKYEVINEHTGNFIASFITKGDAVKKAREYTEKYQAATRITMKKELDKGSAIVARVKYKQSPTERGGRWVFFGWAAE
jgi:ribosomal protein L4